MSMLISFPEFYFVVLPNGYRDPPLYSSDLLVLIPYHSSSLGNAFSALTLRFSLRAFIAICNTVWKSRLASNFLPKRTFETPLL